MEIADVLNQFERITEELAGLHRELGAVRQTQIEARTHALGEMHENVTAMRLAAEHASGPATAEVVVLEAEIAACQERKEYLKALLDQAVWG